MKKIIVMGAGMSGLSAAAYLSRRGFPVTLLEKQGHLGGYVTSFHRDGYDFEATTHQILGIRTPGYVDDIIRSVGLEEVEWIKGDTLNEFVLYHDDEIRERHCFPASSRDILSKLETEFPGFRKELAALFKGQAGLLREALALMRLTKRLGILPQLANAVFALMLRSQNPVCHRLGVLRYRRVAEQINLPYGALMEAFRGPDAERLIWLLSQYWFYLGVPPSRVSAVVLGIVTGLFYSDGPYMVKGGSAGLADALADTIVRHGGVIVRNEGATRIDLEGDRVAAVIGESGRRYEADLIISALNPQDTFFGLIGRRRLPGDYCEALDRMTLSPSAFQVYLGLPFRVADYGFRAPTTFFNASYDAEESFAAIGSGPTARTPLMMSAFEHFDTPGQSVTLLEYDHYNRWAPLVGRPAVDGKRGSEAYRRQKQETQNAIVEKASRLTGIPFNRAEVAFSATPLTFQRYTASPQGCALSSELSVSQSFVKRLGASTPVRGLYLTGSFVAGPGITSCLSSGVRTANEMIRAERL